MSRRHSPPAHSAKSDPDDAAPLAPVDPDDRRASPAPSSPPPELQRPPSHPPHPSLAPPLSNSTSHALQPQTTDNARHHLAPGPDERQQPIPLHLQPAIHSSTHPYPQNRQIALEPQRSSLSSPKHQSTKGGVRGRITVVCAECKRLKLRCDRQRPCTSCVKRTCTERCKYRSELDFVPPPDLPPKPPLNNGHESPYRVVSQSCIECSNQRVKCDRKEPCGSCSKRGLAAECTYANLPPLPTPNQWSWLTSRLTRLEARLAEFVTAPCQECYEKRLECDRNRPCSWCTHRKTPRCTYPANSSPPSSHHSPAYPTQSIPTSNTNAPDMVVKRLTSLENTLNDYTRSIKVGPSGLGLPHQPPHPPPHHTHPSLQLPPVNIPSSPPPTSRHQFSASLSAAPSSSSSAPPEISNIMSLLSAPPPNRGSASSGSSGPSAPVALGPGVGMGMGARHTVSSPMSFSVPSPLGDRDLSLANGSSYRQPPTSDHRDQNPPSRDHTSEIEEDELAMEDIEEA